MYVFLLLPVFSLVLFSFQDGSVPAPPFHGPTLRWYQIALSNKRLTDVFQNSILVAIASSVVVTLLGFTAAYAIARYDLKFKKTSQFLLMAPLSVSTLIIGLGLLIMLNAARVPKSLVNKI